MSAAAVILPFVWATKSLQVIPPQQVEPPQRPIPQEMALYRKYTEGMLRQYLRLTMEAGRVSSLLGQEMFRGKVTSCRLDSFDDVVIFIHDVEKCLEKLDEEQQRLIARIALQQYTVEETAGLMRLRPKTVVRRYRQAIDSLTRVFLQVKMLEPQKSCQGGKIANFRSSY
jgi:Sigma-70, region 4